MGQDKLIVRGAREHNLKNVDLELPRDRLIVVTGLSGSGKSSLAFDTIYAEGQRRYVESLSAYARQFLGLMEKPDVDQIEGLSPAISIDQKGASRNPRSTVGTITEIYDYLRLLYARVGVPHCPNCGRMISAQTVEQIVDTILSYPDGSRLLLLAPLVIARKGEHKGIFEDVRKAGFVRVRVDGEMHEVENAPELDRYKNHTIEAVVDRLIIRRPEPGREDEMKSRLADSVETALKLGNGVMLLSDLSAPGADGSQVKGAQADEDVPAQDAQTRDRLFSERFACPVCGISLPEIEPRTFSFNSPHGACPTCTGLGSMLEFDPDLIVDRAKSLEGGAVRPWDRDTATIYHAMLQSVSDHYHIPFNVPVQELSKGQLDIIVYGARKGDVVPVRYVNNEGHDRYFQTNYEGVVPNLQRRYRETQSDYIRSELEQYMTARPCPTCEGRRLRPEALAVTITDLNIDSVSHFSITNALAVDRTAGGAGDQRRNARGRRQRQWRQWARGDQPCRQRRAEHLQSAGGGQAHRLVRDRAHQLAALAAGIYDRPADPEGAARPPALPDRRRTGLPGARPPSRDPLGRRGAAHPVGHPDRLAADGGAVHPGRALHRVAPARQRAADPHAGRPAQSG